AIPSPSAAASARAARRSAPALRPSRTGPTGRRSPPSTAPARQSSAASLLFFSPMPVLPLPFLRGEGRVRGCLRERNSWIEPVTRHASRVGLSPTQVGLARLAHVQDAQPR